MRANALDSKTGKFERLPKEGGRSNLVGCEWLEHSTYGLRVGVNIYLAVLIDADRINTNQQLTADILGKNTV